MATRRRNVQPKRSSTRSVLGVLVAAITAAAVTVIGVTLLGGGSSDKPAGQAAAANTDSGQSTGGISASAPAADLPGTPSVAGVEIDQPAVDLGRVALNTPVRHLFRLKNAAAGAVSLGKARIEVLEGC